jgi:hypothetical protein
VEYLYAAPVDAGGAEPELVILPRDVAERQAVLVRALAQAETWGELAAAVPPEMYEEILGIAGYGTFEAFTERFFIGRPLPGVMEEAAATYTGEGPPDPDEPFALDEIGAFGDGDFPPDVRYLMAAHLPFDIVGDFGRRYETVFNGTFAEFPASAAEAVVAALTAQGHACFENRATVEAMLLLVGW